MTLKSLGITILVSKKHVADPELLFVKGRRKRGR